MDPGPTSITFSGLAIRRPESSVQRAYEELEHDPLDPTEGENVTVRVASGKLVPAPISLASREILNIDVSSIFHPGQLRFALRGMLGKGGTSRVFAAFDVDLDRELAIKVVPRQREGLRDQLAREASITARLSHPNVPPIFDVGRVGDDYFIALPLIRGRSLRFRIRQALREKERSALAPGELVQVLLKVCDALSYAHARGIIHKDIKPDNIMVGEFGEVMVVDWGSATVEGEPPQPEVAVGTPAYMAPEQATGRELDARADVFALGATLFHALLLRKPLRGGDLEETIRRRSAGELDPPTTDELIGHPRALLAIAVRAMSFNPSDRYQSVASFADALRAYLAGGDAWSEPILDETFQEENWFERWYPNSQDAFTRRELSEENWTRRSSPPSQATGHATFSAARQTGRDYVEWCLETMGDGRAFVAYPELFQPRVALDFEGTMLRGFPPGELTVVWTEDDVILSDGGSRLPLRGTRTLSFRVGAMGNHVAGIFAGLDRPLATSAFRLHRGRASRIRVEVDGVHLRLLVDGDLIAHHELDLPLGPGRFGLLGSYAGKRFARVRVRERGTPGTVGALAIGDAFYARRLYREALEEYERVGIDPSNTKGVSELLYKRGLCAHELGEPDVARALWQKLEGSQWRARVALHEAEGRFRAGEHAEAVRILRETTTLGHSALPRVKETWARLVGDALTRDQAMLDDYLDLRRDLFADDAQTRSLTARALLAMGEFDRVLEEFPDARIEKCHALCARGKFHRVVGDLDVDAPLRDMALLQRGEFDEISDAAGSVMRRMILEGRAKEALALSKEAMPALAAGEYPLALMASDSELRERVTALIRAGRVGEALRTEHPLAYLAEGKADEAQKRAGSAEMRLRVLHYRALLAFFEGEQATFSRLVDEASLSPFSFVWQDVWFERYFLLPLCGDLLGQTGLFTATMETVVMDFEPYWAKRGYFMAAYILGKIEDKDFLAQPAKGSAAGRLYLARALRAEAERSPLEAAQAYSVFNSLKPHHRFIGSVLLNPCVDAFTKRRAQTLR